MSKLDGPGPIANAGVSPDNDLDNPKGAFFLDDRIRKSLGYNPLVNLPPRQTDYAGISRDIVHDVGAVLRQGSELVLGEERTNKIVDTAAVMTDLATERFKNGRELVKSFLSGDKSNSAEDRSDELLTAQKPITATKATDPL